MRSRLPCFIMFLFFVVSGRSQNQFQSDEMYVDSVMNQYFQPNGPGAVILVSKQGKPMIRKAYGLANLEFNIPNKPEYIFNIGSMSKQFTALCVLILVQDGKLDLRDDIRKHLPDYNTHGRRITVENLLHHTSGIKNYSDKEDFFSRCGNHTTCAQLKDYFMNDSLVFEPNAYWSYCNSGYVLAGLIVEKVSGNSLSNFLSAKIFKPCGMINTFVENRDSVVINSVNGYENVNGLENTTETKYKPATYISHTYAYGAGGIMSTVDDLLKYNMALVSGKIINKQLLEQAWAPCILPDGKCTNYGMGWAVGNFRGMRFIAHGGALAGFRSYGILFPEKELYVTVLSNNSAKTPVTYATPIAFKIAGASLSPVKEIGLEDKALLTYTGTYTFTIPALKFLLAERKIALEGKKLISKVIIDNEIDEENELICISKDLFIAKNSTRRFEFKRNKKGEITSIETYNFPISYGPHETEVKVLQSVPGK